MHFENVEITIKFDLKLSTCLACHYKVCTLSTRANLNPLSINPILLVYMYIKLIWLIHTTCVCSLQSTIPLGTQLALLKLDIMFYRWNERCLLTGLMIEFVPYSRFVAYKKKKKKKICTVSCLNFNMIGPKYIQCWSFMIPF